jgi:NADPH2:quinone reductase
MFELPKKMTAILAETPGGPEVLKAYSVPLPVVGPGEVLIRVTAAGVNRPDAKQRAGEYPPPPGVTDILGLEVSGHVVALGKGVAAEHLGRKVCALVAGGGYAEYCSAPLAQVLPAPSSISLIEAAAVPETTFTVWGNMMRIGRLKKGETVLVHGGTSGIGTTAIQIARAIGANVIATAGTDIKVERCLELGANAAINYRKEDFTKRVLDLTNERGVDAILDIVCADYLKRNLACLAQDGRLIVVSFLGGGVGEIDFKALTRNRHLICGSTLRPQSIERKGVIAEDLREIVWPMIAAGAYRPVIQSQYKLTQASQAHAELEAGHHVGKIVLTVG